MEYGYVPSSEDCDLLVREMRYGLLDILMSLGATPSVSCVERAIRVLNTPSPVVSRQERHDATMADGIIRAFGMKSDALKAVEDANSRRRIEWEAAQLRASVIMQVLSKY